MTSTACALLTAAGFYFSLGLGEQWWLAWLAPIPILWLAFGKTNAWQVFVASWVAMAGRATSVLRAYGGLLPTIVPDPCASIYRHCCLRVCGRRALRAASVGIGGGDVRVRRAVDCV